MGKDLPPRDDFIILYNAIKSADMVPQHTHLLDLLWVTCTLTDDCNIPIVTQNEPWVQTILSMQLICWMKTKVLFWDLQGLVPQTAPVSSSSDAAIKDALSGLNNF